MSFLSSAHRIQGRRGRAVKIGKLWRQLSWHSSRLTRSPVWVAGRPSLGSFARDSVCQPLEPARPGEAHPLFICSSGSEHR